MATPRHFSGYKRLDVFTREIRIITILAAASDSDEIRCELTSIPLAQANPFHALSYVWGSAAESEPIKLDGETVLLRKNLWQCLYSLRLVKGSLRLWVDYICINQSDLDERNSQVSMMAEIYQGADATFAWLGDPTPESEIAFDYLQRPQQQQGRRRNTTSERNRKCTYMVDLLQRPYWDRTWIVQEAALAKVLWFVVGTRMTEWKTLRSWLIFHGRHGKAIASATKLRQHRIRIWEFVSDFREQGTRFPLSELVASVRGSSCHDPKDKIYGVMSLTDENVRSCIKVDYSRTSLQIFLDSFHVWDWETTGYLKHDSGQKLYSGKERDLPKLFLQLYSQHMHELHLDLVLWRQGLNKDVPLFKPILMFAECLLARTTYFTIAFVDAKQQTIHCADKNNANISSATAFVSVAIIEGDRPHIESTYLLLYTNVLPQAGDLLVTIGQTCLLLHKVHGECVVVGSGLQTALSDLIPLDPLQWADSLIPDKNYQVEQWKQKTEDRQFNDQTATAWFNVLLDGPSVVELIQTESLQTTNLMTGKEGVTYSSTWSVTAFAEQHSLSMDIRFWQHALHKRMTGSIEDDDILRRLPCVQTDRLEALKWS